jgi:hypothetical protein
LACELLHPAAYRPPALASSAIRMLLKKRVMEIIPIDDESAGSVAPASNSAAIEKNHLGPQPLAVESLENRVLLATDVAPAAAAAPPDMEAPTAPAAYVAQQHPPHETGQAGNAQSHMTGGEPPEVTEHDGSAAGGSEMSAQGHGDAAIVGLVRHNGESHVEIVERASESKEQVEPDVEHKDKAERRFGGQDSSVATIEPEEAQSPRDRAAAKRLVATDPNRNEMETAVLDSGEAARATASAIVSLANQTDQAVGDTSMNQVVDELAIKLAQDTSIERPPETITANSRQNALQTPADDFETNAAAREIVEHANVQTGGDGHPAEPSVADGAGDTESTPLAAHDAVFTAAENADKTVPLTNLF